MKKFISILASVIILSLASSSLVLADDYIISAGDALVVSVWGSPEFSMQTLVRPDGKITLPAVGDVEASDLTSEQLKERLTEAIGKFVKKPIVTVIITTMTNNKVFISGGGVGTGVVNLSGNMTLFRLLCQVGSLSETDLVSSYLSRDGEKLVENFYPLFMQGDLSQDTELKANDIIHIPSNKLNKIYVVGAVGAPQIIIWRYDLRVLDVILGAGGFNEYAKKSNIVIVRKDGTKHTVDMKKLLSGKDIKQNIPVAPGDYVIVKESIF
ncbi:MAG: polysaccharide biosynthesis/export family protein [Deltaproteobacteria bacterium]|nr:polysaccharide biosynthesis/export family protein [Candidatus Tharpella sp.]